MGDQCCFGKRDLISGLSERKRTGWLSNSEVLLNQICRQCTCPRGAREQVVGNNSLGNRAKQAAEYPIGLCRAICRGVTKEMEMQYVLKELRGEHAMPVVDTEPEDAEMDDALARIPGELTEAQDSWELREDLGQLIRHHRVPRRALFLPVDGTDAPVLMDRLTSKRTVHGSNLGEEQTFSFDDDWTDRQDGGRDLDRFWTGNTVFHLHPQELAQVSEHAAPRQSDEPRALRRRRARTRQLQRGLWTIVSGQVVKT